MSVVHGDSVRSSSAAYVESAPAPPSRVVFLCPTAWSVRNVIHSGLAERLGEAGVTVHLIVPDALRPGTIGDGKSIAAAHEMLIPALTRRLRGKAALNTLLRAAFARRNRLASYRIFADWERRNDTLRQRLRNGVVTLCSIPASRSPLFEWLTGVEERWSSWTRDERSVAQQLAQLRPVLIVSTCCVDQREGPYLRAARRLGIPTLGWILSFDNLTSRSVLPMFEAYAVWTSRMRDRVLELYPDRDSERIHVTGTPQFDFHVRSDFRWDRSRTLQALDLADHERYLVYAANCAEFTPTEPNLVEGLVHRMLAVPELSHHRVVIRLHPLDEAGRWARLEQSDLPVRIVKPWGVNGLAPQRDDQVLLVSSLAHADACVNFASTISLDAAALDTPVICVGFGYSKGSSEDQFARAVYRTEHYRPIVESGGVRLASNMDELLARLLECVRDRSVDHELRQQLVAQECGLVDGRAVERMSALVAEMVNGQKRRSSLK